MIAMTVKGDVILCEIDFFSILFQLSENLTLKINLLCLRLCAWVREKERYRWIKMEYVCECIFASFFFSSLKCHLTVYIEIRLNERMKMCELSTREYDLSALKIHSTYLVLVNLWYLYISPTILLLFRLSFFFFYFFLFELWWDMLDEQKSKSTYT